MNFTNTTESSVTMHGNGRGSTNYSGDPRALLNFLVVILLIILIPHIVLICVKIIRYCFPSCRPHDPWAWEDLAWIAQYVTYWAVCQALKFDQAKPFLILYTRERHVMQNHLAAFVSRRLRNFSLVRKAWHEYILRFHKLGINCNLHSYFITV